MDGVMNSGYESLCSNEWEALVVGEGGAATGGSGAADSPPGVAERGAGSVGGGVTGEGDWISWGGTFSRTGVVVIDVRRERVRSSAVSAGSLGVVGAWSSRGAALSGVINDGPSGVVPPLNDARERSEYPCRRFFCSSPIPKDERSAGLKDDQNLLYVSCSHSPKALDRPVDPLHDSMNVIPVAIACPVE